MKLSVIIGTKNRPRRLADLLNCLSKQTRRPDEVIIVDDGNGAFKPPSEFNIFYKYINKNNSPGTVKSRKLGFKESSGDIIIFLDDDVAVGVDYMDAVLKAFEADKTGCLGGISGIVEDRIGLLQRIFLRIFCLDSERQGMILSSGCGVTVKEIEEPLYVEWLSGCNMGFRREVFKEFQFDEAFGGNGWGDDRDFSYRVSKKFKLLVTPKAHVIHYEEAAGRLPGQEFGYIEIKHFYLFFKKNMPKTIMNWLCFWRALAGIVLKNLLSGDLNQLKGNMRGLRYLLMGERN